LAHPKIKIKSPNNLF